jgi:hypothetical protein
MAPKKAAIAAEDGPTSSVPAKAAPTKTNLAALLGAGKVHEDEQRSSAGRDKSYVQIIKDPKDKILNEGKPEFIKGAKYEGYCIPNKKIWLGMTPEVVIVGLFKVYEERIPVPPGSKEMPPLVGMWMPQDAEQVPVEGQFDRPFLSRGDNKIHVLNPAHWVCLWSRKHPDVDDMVITFRSVGNSIYQQLVKLIKQSGVAFAPQLKIRLAKPQEKEAKNYNDKVYLYPNFEIVDGLVDPVLLLMQQSTIQPSRRIPRIQLLCQSNLFFRPRGIPPFVPGLAQVAAE